MILERHRELTINLGNNTYESAKISARVSFDTSNPLDTETIINNSSTKDASEAADTILSEALKSEVEYWHEITTKKDSFVHLVHEDNKERETKNA